MIDKMRVTVVRSLILRLLVLSVGLACGGQVCAYDFKAEPPGGVVIYYDINGKDVTVTSGDKEYAGDVKIPSKVEHGGVAYDVTAIGQDAFFKCENLKSIFIPECVTSIGDRAFCGCNGLTALSFNEGLKSIGYYAFSDCNKLTSIRIPANITNIQYGAFAANSSLKEIVVDEKNKVYDSREGCNAIIETSTNTLIVGCQTTTIPNSVTALGRSAFFYCQALEGITIPESVVSIDNFAFYRCTKLASINIPGNVATIGPYAFEDCKNLATLSLNEGLKQIGYRSFFDCDKLESVRIPASVMEIEDEAFGSGNAMKEIVVDEKNGIYDSREGCNAIIETSTNKLIEGCQTTRIPNSVTAIGYGAFSHCETLKSLVIPESVSSIGIHAFYSCNNLDTVVSMVKKPFSITSDVFYSIGKTAKLYVPEGTKKAYTSLEGWNSRFAEIIVNPSSRVGH